jgi:hypothetical protein
MPPAAIPDARGCPSMGEPQDKLPRSLWSVDGQAGSNHFVGRISTDKRRSRHQPLPPHAGPNITSHHQHQLALHHLKLGLWHI